MTNPQHAPLEDISTWPQTIPNIDDSGVSLPFKILRQNGTFQEDFSEVSEVWLIPGDRLVSFARYLFPKPSLGQGNIPIYNNRVFDGDSSLGVQRMTWRPFVPGVPTDVYGVDPVEPHDFIPGGGGSAGGPYHKIIEVELFYSNQKNQAAEKPESYLELAGSASGEFIHAPQENASWESSSDPTTTPQIPSSVLVPMIEWTVRWKQIPRNYFDETMMPMLRKRLGRVNSKVMPFLFNAPPETILFVGFDCNEEWQQNETQALPMSLEMKFLEKRYSVEGEDTVRGHNDYWRPGVGWQKLLVAETGKLTYDSIDHNLLYIATTTLAEKQDAADA